MFDVGMSGRIPEILKLMGVIVHIVELTNIKSAIAKLHRSNRCVTGMRMQPVPAHSTQIPHALADNCCCFQGSFRVD